jgi:hypothetical protein
MTTMLRCQASTRTNAPPATTPVTRRALALLPLLAAAPRPAAAAQAPVNREVDNASSPFIQELLRRTEEKREERVKERLDDYYRRNFGDYFSFEAGSNMGSKGISPETQAQIKKWLEENSDEARRAAKTFPK